jgi:hypothetical protein
MSKERLAPYGHNLKTNIGAMHKNVKKDYPKLKKKAKPLVNYLTKPAPRAKHRTSSKRASANGVIVNGRFYPTAAPRKSKPVKRRARKENSMFDFDFEMPTL